MQGNQIFVAALSLAWGRFRRPNHMPAGFQALEPWTFQGLSRLKDIRGNPGSLPRERSQKF